MNGFLIYEVKAAVALAIFYMFYRLVLRKETLHRFNRATLVGSVILSFILPLCIITIKRPMPISPETGSAIPVELPALPSPTETAGPVTPWWQILLVTVFWSGVLISLTRTAISILSIRKVLKGSTLAKKGDGYDLYVTPKEADPFSWMKYIVIKESDYASPHEAILLHERAHIRLGHSVEILLIDILSSLQWFNPAIHMLRSDLQEIHEYEADDAVLREGTPIKDYQYLLIRKAVSKSGYSVANSFNHSILKNRITMMSKSKSPLSRGLRVLYLVPLVCLGLGLQARTVFVPTDKDNENIISQDQKKGFLPEVTVIRYYGNNQDPSKIIKAGDNFTATVLKVDPIWNEIDSEPKCSEDFSFWLNSRINYPNDCLYEGTMFASFTVDNKGKVKNVKILKGVCDELDSQVVSLIEKSPSWTPAKKDGKDVKVTFIQPVIFGIRVPQAQKAAAGATIKSLQLEVSADPSGAPIIKSYGSTIALDKLAQFLKDNGMTDSSSAINIKADALLPMNTLDKVKDEIRKAGTLRVNYLVPEEKPTGSQSSSANSE